jgi:hypothetical protein
LNGYDDDVAQQLVKYSASLENWRERRLAKLRAALENFIFKKSEVTKRAQAVADAMVVSIQGSRIIRHLSLQITKLIHLSPGPAFPQNGAKNGHVFEPIGTNDSVVDILSAACSDADDEVYRLVQQLYHLTLDTSDWRCEAVRSVYSGVEPHIYHVAATGFK